MKWSRLVQAWIVLAAVLSVLLLLFIGKSHGGHSSEPETVSPILTKQFAEVFARDSEPQTAPQEKPHSSKPAADQLTKSVSSKDSAESWPATVGVDDGSVNMRPNPLGNYSLVTVPTGAVIPIQLHGKPHDNFQVQVLDGGQLDNQTSSQTFSADNNGNVAFHYEVESNPGKYRLAVAHDGKHEVFNFWVGASFSQRVTTDSQQ